MENDVKAEFEKLQKEINQLKKDSAQKDRVIRKLSNELKNSVKRVKYLKEVTNRNAHAIDSLRNALRKILQ